MSVNDNKLAELMLAITDKYDAMCYGGSVQLPTQNITRLISELPVETLFSKPYDVSPLGSARVFKDTDTVLQILGKEGVLPDNLPVDRNTAVNDRVELLDAISHENARRTVELLEKVGGYKNISPNQAVRRVYKHGIERNFGVTIEELKATVQSGAVQAEIPAMLSGRSQAVE